MNRRSLEIVMVFALVSAIGAFVYGSLGQARANEIGSERTATVYLTYDQLAVMPISTVNAELDCAGTLIAEGNWTGVKLSLVLEEAGVKPDAQTLEFHASDRYTFTINYLTATRDDVIIAYELNGARIPEGLRLVLPNAPGYQWISKITDFVVSYPLGSSMAHNLTH